MARKQRPSEPFPHICPECGATAVYPETTNYRTAFKYEGQLHEFEAPNVTLNKCRDCGGTILPNTALDQITEAFRRHVNLLTAEEIRGGLAKLQLSQKDFAERIGAAPKSVSDWLANLRFQPRSLDRMMRSFFKSAAP
jgi:DNA-binding transcriptional regulator YiaG